MTRSARYPVDLESIDRHMCPGFPPPKLLAAFARWVETRAWGSVGHFDLRGERFPDGYVEAATDLAPHLGLFVHLPEGSLLGFWRPLGTERDTSIVLVGSEGEMQIAAKSLGEMLWRIALARFSTRGPLEEFLPSDDDDEPIPDARAELTAWLRAARVPRPSPATLDDPFREGTRSLKKWLSAHDRRERARLARAPAAQTLAARLRRELPRKAEPWEHSGVEVVFASGDRAALRWWPPFENGKARKAPPAADRDQMIDLVRALRDADAERFPDRGPFVSALATSSTEAFSLRRHYLEQPDAWHGFTKADLVREVRRHPRTQYWTPDWAR